MNVITATGQIWRQKYASPREGRFPSATAGREDLQGAAVIRYFRGTISRKVRTDCKDKDIKGLKDRYKGKRYKGKRRIKKADASLQKPAGPGRTKHRKTCPIITTGQAKG